MYSKYQNPFLSLPRELTLAIYGELDLSDLRHIRLTCKLFSNDAASLVLSHIFISETNATTIEEVVFDLQSITKADSAAVNSSSQITFHDLSSLFCDRHEGNVDHISDDLLAALTSFKKVQTVNWYTGENDPLWLQAIIWTAITKFPCLRHLNVNSSFLKRPLRNFDSLKALESVYIICHPFAHEGAMFLSLSELYASSSNLNSITIEHIADYDVDLTRAHGLQNLLSSSPKENPAHCLRRLSLSNVPVRLDEVSLSHLTHLKSFTLSSLLMDTRKREVLNPPGEIWVAFQRSKICLEELEVGYGAIAESLIDYLSSFSGLKKLRLSIPFCDFSSVNFWSESLPNHVDTLQDFSLNSQYDGKWCFGHHNRSLIERCTKLEQLTICLLPQDIPTKEGDFNGFNTLMDTVVTHMPQIQQIDLEVPLRKAMLGRCATPTYSMRKVDKQRLQGCIMTYTPPATCQRLPELTLNTRSTHVFVENARGSQLGYCKSEDV